MAIIGDINGPKVGSKKNAPSLNQRKHIVCNMFQPYKKNPLSACVGGSLRLSIFHTESDRDRMAPPSPQIEEEVNAPREA